MKIRNISFSLITVFVFTYGLVFAKAKDVSEISDLKLLRSIAILDEGRIKPLDTFARTVLLKFSGKSSFEKKPAINWLAKLIFTPWETMEDKVFLINSPEIPAAVNIPADKRRRYSYSQLKSGLEKLRELAVAADAIEPKERSIVETEVLRVYHNLIIYNKLYSLVSFTVPHPDFAIKNSAVKASLGFPPGQEVFSFIDIALKADKINQETESLETKKSKDWNSEEHELMRLLRNLYQWSLNSSREEGAAAIMPPINTENTEIWLSPWEMIRSHFAQPVIRVELFNIQQMADAYQNGQQLEFNTAAKALQNSVSGRVAHVQNKAYQKIPLELSYNQNNYFQIAWALYLLTFFIFLLSLVYSRPFIQQAAFIFLALGFIPHMIGMIIRTIIMSRPPVTNLYETFIFVGLVCVLLGLITEHFNKKWLGIVVGSICGCIALSIASKFAAEGDTLKMLVAVLDSNFWLGTHVITITIGYAGCCVAGIMGHVYIIQAMFNNNKPELLNSTFRYIVGTLGFGLATAFLGTMLGGIWADQSWGRFWGWDPKENGALLIVLWTAIIFHAKAGKLIKPLGVAVGASLGLIVVMWAWFGVNLLSIGLHSYGFTSGLAVNLAIFVGIELIFLAVSLIILIKRGTPF